MGKKTVRIKERMTFPTILVANFNIPAQVTDKTSESTHIQKISQTVNLKTINHFYLIFKK